jgi:hypothetical protein
MMNNDNYCWSHGYQVHNGHTSARYKNQKEGHNKDVTKTNPMGGVKWGKEGYEGAAKVLDHKLDQFTLTLDCTPPTSSVSMNDTAILDYGCTSNFLSATAPWMNKCAAHVPLYVNIPNGTTIQSSHTSDLLLSALPPEVRRAHILPGLVHNSLISVGQLCDSGCNVTFTQDKVEVNKDGNSVMSGVRDQQLWLWRVALQETPKSNYKNACNHAHETSNLKELINYLYATAFSAVKSTWIKLIKKGNFSSWPGLTENAVEKHLSKSKATVKGHWNQQRMYARSTKPKKEPERSMEYESNLDDGIKTHCIYAAVVDAWQIYTDQTGRFPVI